MYAKFNIAAAMLRRALDESRLTQTEAARRAGVAREEVWHVLTGTRKNSCRVDTLVALLAACGFELKMEKKR